MFYHYPWHNNHRIQGLPEPRSEIDRDVVSFFDALARPIWKGFIACEDCSSIARASIETATLQTKVQKHVHCPNCRSDSAIPSAHWFASAMVRCRCGHRWPIVYLDEQPLPTRVKCPSCEQMASEFVSWPEEW